MRHQHMVDLLMPNRTIDSEVEHFSHKHELTVEDFDLIIKNAECMKRAAEIARSFALK